MPVGGESYILGTGTFGQVEKVQRKKDQKVPQQLLPASDEFLCA